MSKDFGFGFASKKPQKTAEHAKVIKSYKWKKKIYFYTF